MKGDPSVPFRVPGAARPRHSPVGEWSRRSCSQSRTDRAPGPVMTLVPAGPPPDQPTRLRGGGPAGSRPAPPQAPPLLRFRPRPALPAAPPGPALSWKDCPTATRKAAFEKFLPDLNVICSKDLPCSVLRVCTH